MRMLSDVTGTVEPIRCPCCGRRTFTDMLRDYRNLPRAICPSEFACDACGEKMVMLGKISRADIARLCEPEDVRAERVEKAEHLDTQCPAQTTPPSTDAVEQMVAQEKELQRLPSGGAPR